MTQRKAPHSQLCHGTIQLLLRWVVLPLCLAAPAALAALYLLCIFQPALVTAKVEDYLNAHTGLPWRINGLIRPVLAPAPGIIASDVRILAASTEQGPHSDLQRPLVHANFLELSLDPASLLELAPRIRHIDLDAPVINLAYDNLMRPLWVPLSTQEILAPSPQPAGAQGVNVAASQASGKAKLKELADFFLILADKSSPPIGIRNGSLNSYTDSGNLLLAFSGIDAELSPKSPSHNLTLAATFSLPRADLAVRFTVEATLGKNSLPAVGTVSGEIGMTPPGSRTIHASFSTDFTWKNDGNLLLLPDLRFLAEGNGLTANLEADLSALTCTGPVQIHKLSLPRWFGFGRSLPPGLQQPLDNLIGEFDLFLDAHTAQAINLRGALNSMAVSGYVGVQEFTEPVVVVDLDVGQANLDLLFPFLSAVGKYVPEPVSPEFDHSVLAPYPEDPSAPPPPADPSDPEIDVSYDVKVRVARPLVHDVETGPLEVLVHPIIVNKLEKTRVAFSNVAALRGIIDGRLDIDETSMLMRYALKDVELGLLPENKENRVRIKGRTSGTCEIDVPLLPNGKLADLWKINVNATIQDCDITAHYVSMPWRFFAGKTKVTGAGDIFAVLHKGVRIEGLWDLAVQGIKTSWNPKGNDSITGTLKGGLHWPPMQSKPYQTNKSRRLIGRRGVESVNGELKTDGSLIVPLGNMLVPVKGKLDAYLTWLPYDEKISLKDLAFEGFGSYTEGNANIDFSGKEVVVRCESSFKINPRELLGAWKLLPPQEFLIPKILTGKTNITGKSGSLLFDKVKMEADGAAITGEIFWQSAKSAGQSREDSQGLWTVRLAADHLNLNNFFPQPPQDKPPPPAAPAPWQLASFKGLALDAQLFIFQGKYKNFSFAKTKATATLQRNRFSLHANVEDFYSGKATLLFQGALLPSASRITLRKGLIQMQKVALDKLIYDYTKEQFYAGTADLVIDLAGELGSSADIPGKLSGIWSMNIKDGLYPAFLSSEDSTLRNTFSAASASGEVVTGIISSNNFKLSGPMVDMNGGGWLDMNSKKLEIEVSVTFAKIPTVPVSFYGTTSAPRMRVRGVDMVMETFQAAGMTVFSLVRNVLELPAHAVRGISSLFGAQEKTPAGAKQGSGKH